jgi:hypothetical protein
MLDDILGAYQASHGMYPRYNDPWDTYLPQVVPVEMAVASVGPKTVILSSKWTTTRQRWNPSPPRAQQEWETVATDDRLAWRC